MNFSVRMGAFLVFLFTIYNTVSASIKSAISKINTDMSLYSQTSFDLHLFMARKLTPLTPQETPPPNPQNRQMSKTKCTCKVHEKPHFVAVTHLIYLGERVLFEVVPFNCCVALSAFSLITTLSEGSKLGS